MSDAPTEREPIVTGVGVAVAQAWIDRMSAALVTPEAARIEDLFTADASWRDIVSLTGSIHSVIGRDELAAMLARAAEHIRPRSLRVSELWEPQFVERADRRVLEIFVRFDTEAGTGEGVVRLSDEPTPRAWTVMTALESLHARPEASAGNRPVEYDFTVHFGAATWLDEREAAASYTDRDPTVLVVGAGQAGLTIAARLRAMGVDVLVLEASARVGDGWRNRYHSLWLHNEVEMNHLPYLPFPDTWPVYLSKDMLAAWLEFYAFAMELNVWTGTRFTNAEWDTTERHWTTRVQRSDGTTRTLRPKHIVVSTGVSGAPKLPDIPGLADFRGEVMHSSEFRGAEDYRGKRAVIFGVGNSGSDVAQEMHALGGDVTMVQRGKVTVVSHYPAGLLLIGSMYRSGVPVDVCDLIAIATPGPASIEASQAQTRKIREVDRELIERLKAVGFRTDYGHDDTGFGMKYLRYGGGHYLNVGCSELIASGNVRLVQHNDIVRVVPEGVLLSSGEVREADMIVLATGFHTLNAQVRDFFGEEVANRVGPVWGMDEENEQCNMWRATAQPGLWFHAGSLHQCRLFSKYLALQIVAEEMSRLGDAAEEFGDANAVDLAE
jgi:cation diffusion facilitator CzcD-associated flavoprotein CzcO